MTNTSTDRVYAFVRDYQQRTAGRAPTVREICAGLALKSTSLVAYYVDKLVAEGRLEREEGARGIRVKGGEWVAPREIIGR